MRKLKSDGDWVRCKGRLTMNVKGAVPMGGAKQPIATYSDRGVLQVCAKFDTKVSFNELKAKRYLAPKLKAMFKPQRQLLILECCPHTFRGMRNQGRYTNFEYYARCEQPDPSAVQQIHRIVGDVAQECREE